MRARLARFKPVFVLLLLIAIPLAALILVNLLIAPAVSAPTSDNTPGFQTLAPETSVRVADYQLAYTKSGLVLTNTLTRAAATIAENYTAAVAPAYTLFYFKNQPYLITRLGSSGSSGIYGFKVIRLDQDQAEDLTDPTSNPNMGLSCSNPRFDGSALIFEISLKCTNGAAVHDSSYQSYSVPLH